MARRRYGWLCGLVDTARFRWWRWRVSRQLDLLASRGDVHRLQRIITDVVLSPVGLVSTEGEEANESRLTPLQRELKQVANAHGLRVARLDESNRPPFCRPLQGKALPPAMPQLPAP
jgi:hypothetical protein